MTRTTLANLGALILGLGLAAIIAGAIHEPMPGRRTANRAQSTLKPEALPAPATGLGLRDATGTLIPIGHYRKILSLGMLTDRLLLELAEPDQILAVTDAAASADWSYHHAGKPRVNPFGPLDALLARQPDLVLINSSGAWDRPARLRTAGLTVFVLGEPRGVDAMLHAARAIAMLLGEGARGERFAQTFQRRLRRIAASRPAGPRKNGMYIAALGSQIYGGAARTSYHDVLIHAGLTDVAATRFADWPQYTAEQVLALAPEIVVTKQGMGSIICRHPGLERLAPCQDDRAIVELPAALLDEPGPAILDAAEWVFDQVYGSPRPTP